MPTYEYVPVTRPKAKVIGQNGNIFNTLAISSSALRNAKLPQSADEMAARVLESGSYEEALHIIQEYVDFK